MQNFSSISKKQQKDDEKHIHTNHIDTNSKNTENTTKPKRKTHWFNCELILPETLIYKTLNSVSESEYFKLIHKHIELSNLLSINIENSSIQHICEQIHLFLNQTNDYEYVEKLFLHLKIIRPKQMELLGNIASKFDSEFRDKNKSLLCKFQTNIDNSIINNDIQTLINILKTDDSEKLNHFISTHPVFTKDTKIPINDYNIHIYPQVNALFSTFNQTSMFLIDICALHGSLNCFKYLYLNKYQMSKQVTFYSVAG